MQNDKLIDITQFPKREIFVEHKIARNQSAYIVEYLLDNYGIEKIKQLWISGMSDFERIYATSIDDVIAEVNKKLKEKYSSPIQFNWNEFAKECIDPQPNDWLAEYEPNTLFPRFSDMITKDFGHLRFTLSAHLSIEKRKEAIENTSKYIAENLTLINETDFTDSLHIIFARNRDEIGKTLGGFRRGGLFLAKKPDGFKNGLDPLVNTVYAIDNPKYSSLKHELMHAVTMQKWGVLSSRNDQLDWLIEGIATFADPEIYSCDSSDFEKRYIFFLQNGKLISLEKLMTFPDIEDEEIKIAYNQSAYLVGVLFEKYGVAKLKALWQSKRMDAFKEIYGITFEQVISDINNRLSEMSKIK